MIENGPEIGELYRDGKICFDRSVLLEIPIVPSARDFLLQHGLPGPFRKAFCLGVHFLDTLIKKEIAGEVFWQFGYEWEPGQGIALKEKSGAVYAIDTGKGTSPVFINADLNIFLHGLNWYRAYAENRAKDMLPVQHYSAEEAASRLADFRNGRMPPSAKPKVPRATEGARQQLVAFFEAQDPQALRDRNNWWSLIMEQLSDGLL
jgi:hypothetical protein